MIPENDWYGHKRVLAEYCGVSRDRPFFGLFAHGWAPDLGEGVGHRSMRFAPFFVWNDRLLQQARAQAVPNVRCIGAPFSYLVASSYPRDRPTVGQGTLVIPAHSTDGPPILYDVEEFIRDVQRHMPGPYTVSIYYMDSNTPAVEAYRRAGFRLVSFGRRLQPDFLTNLAREVEAHEAVVSNVAQTSVWYGALLGKTTRILSRGAYPVAAGQEPDMARERWPTLFEPGASVDDIVQLGAQELGFDRILCPADLRRVLGVDSWWKVAMGRAIRSTVDARLMMQVRRSGFEIDGLTAGDPRLRDS